MRLNQKLIETYSHNKKLLLSLAIALGAVFMISLGVWIDGKITNGAEEKARLYQTAIQTQNNKEFNYSIDTKQGRILAEVVINKVDLVKFDEMNKEFVKVKKTKERYTRHERTVCDTHYRTETRTRSVYNSSTKSYSTETYTVQVPYQVCRQETYYTWDKVDSWEKSAKEVDMSGRKYPIGLFALSMRSIDAKDIIPGQTGKYVREEADTWIDLNWGDDEGDIRYKYEVLELPKSGTVFLNVTEAVRPVFGSKVVLDDKKPAQLVTDAQNAAQTQSTIFTWVWGIMTFGLICTGIYYVWFYE